jgi:hypothetical protein
MKNYIIGSLLLLAAGFLMLDPLQWQPKVEPVNDAPKETASEDEFSQSDGTRTSADSSLENPQSQVVAEGNSSTAFPSANPITLGKEQFKNALENDYSAPLFSNHTGGIREVRLKKQGRLSKDYNMSHSDGEPLLSLSFEDENGRPYKSVLPDPRAFRLVPQTDPMKILYRFEVAGEISIEREYYREANSSYVIDH